MAAVAAPLGSTIILRTTVQYLKSSWTWADSLGQLPCLTLQKNLIAQRQLLIFPLPFICSACLYFLSGGRRFPRLSAGAQYT